MSASNWGYCPRCIYAALVAKAQEKNAAAEAYGKVSAGEWGKLHAESEKPVKHETTLREDYEQGILADGVFYSHYGAECCADGCGFKHTHNHRDQLTVESR